MWDWRVKNLYTTPYKKNLLGDLGKDYVIKEIKAGHINIPSIIKILRLPVPRTSNSIINERR